MLAAIQRARDSEAVSNALSESREALGQAGNSLTSGGSARSESKDSDALSNAASELASNFGKVCGHTRVSWRPTSARFVVTPGLVGVQLRQGLWSHQLRNSETPRVLIIGNKRAHHASAHPALPSPARDCDIPDGRVVWNLALPRSRATVGGRRSESVGLQAGHRNADTRKDTGANHW